MTANKQLTQPRPRWQSMTCSAKPANPPPLTKQSIGQKLVCSFASLSMERDIREITMLQPASLITHRRRQRSNVEDIKTVQNELENLHMILLCKKGSHGVFVRGKQRSISLPNCLESWTLKIMCNSSATLLTATLPQCVQTLLALATCRPPAKRPRTIGSS